MGLNGREFRGMGFLDEVFLGLMIKCRVHVF